MSKNPEHVLGEMMEAAKPHMSEAAYGCLIKVVNWGAQMDRAFMGTLQPDTGFISSMMAPFTGFGNAAAWSQLAPMVTSHILHLTHQWVHDKNNNKPTEPLAAMMVSQLVPIVSQVSMDWENAQDALSAMAKVLQAYTEEGR